MMPIRERLRLAEQPYDGQEVYGVEIEYESAGNVGQPPRHWEYHEDHSLRGGGEWVLRVPVGTEALGELVRVACERLRTERASHSTRTSIHVHMNVRGLDAAQVHKMVQVFIALDPVLFAMSSPQREHNNFAIGQVYCGSSTARLLSALQMNRINDIRRPMATSTRAQLYEALMNLRYGSINIASLFRFGTIEFRHMAGTNDADAIMRYVRVLSAIRNWVLRPEFQTTNELVSLARGEVPDWLPGPMRVAIQETEGLLSKVRATAEMALIADIPYQSRSYDNPSMSSAANSVVAYIRRADAEEERGTGGTTFVVTDGIRAAARTRTPADIEWATQFIQGAALRDQPIDPDEPFPTFAEYGPL